jgi:hypothetical protein
VVGVPCGCGQAHAVQALGVHNAPAKGMVFGGWRGWLGYTIRVADMMPCDPSGSGVEWALVLE